MQTIIFSLFHPPIHFSYVTQRKSSNTLISKKDTARIVKTLLVKTLKLQAGLPVRNFPYIFFFLGIFRATILSSKCFAKNIAI